jgi:hypothetical protein
LICRGDADLLERSIAFSRYAVEYPFSNVRDRFLAAETWSSIARFAQHHTTLPAYRDALSLLRRSIDLGPTIQTRHEYIKGQAFSRASTSLPMDAASYAIEIGAYEEVVELLEQRRERLWSGMRSLRTPLEHLRGVDKVLASGPIHRN